MVQFALGVIFPNEREILFHILISVYDLLKNASSYYKDYGNSYGRRLFKCT